MYNPGNDGLHVASAGRHGIYVGAAGTNGIEIHDTGAHGMYVGSPTRTGVKIEGAGEYGVHVNNGGQVGVYVESAQLGARFNDGVSINGGCLGCEPMVPALNVGQVALEPGDVVAIKGLLPNDFDGQPVLMAVSHAGQGGHADWRRPGPGRDLEQRSERGLRSAPVLGAR